MISPGLVLSNLHNLDLGYHDGEAFTIVLANHEDPELFAITAHHEFLHHVLITGTTFGHLVYRTKRSRARLEPGQYTEVLEQLMNASRGVQEMYATYCSLAEARRLDLVDRLPALYGEAVRRCIRLVEREFSAGLARRSYAHAIARCALMTRPGNEISVEPQPEGKGLTIVPQPENQVIDDLLAGTRADLPDSMWPDRRLDIIEQHLLSLPERTIWDRLSRSGLAWLEAAVNSDSVQELEQRLGAGSAAAAEATVDMHIVLMQMVCELLEDLLPGLSSNYSSAKIVRNMGLHGLDGLLDEARLDEVRLIHDMAAQVVQVVPVADDDLPTPERRPGGREAVRKIGQQIKDSGVAYIYPVWRSTPQDSEVFFAAVDAPERIMECYPLTEAEIGQLFAWRLTEPWLKWITVVEWEDLRNIARQSLTAEMFHAITFCFAHLSGNPTDYLIPYLKAGQMMKWTVVRVVDTNNPAKPTYLEVVFYLVAGNDGWVLYHLSNPSLTAAIMSLTRAVSDPARIEYIPWKQVPNERLAESVQWLGGHPAIALYHVYGKRPEVSTD